MAGKKPKFKPFLESWGQYPRRGIFPMVGLTVSVALKRSFGVVVIFPLIAAGLASMCAATSLACLSSLTIPSPQISDRHPEVRLASVEPPLWNDLWNGRTAGLADVSHRPQQRVQFVSLESHLPGTQPLLRSDLRMGMAVGPSSVPDKLPQGIQFIRFDVPTLAPMAHTRFCLEYPTDCKPERLLLRADRVELDRAHWLELESVNRTINASIRPQRNENGLAGEKWLLSPDRGDCNDYAVTKRHQLIASGWPARTVLLSEVVTGSGEHHLVTVVRTNGGDLVLDNLTDRIMPWSRTPYRWVRIQMPKNPNYWASIAAPNA
jgi:predicted transglutaminase-like cysteine proteinase